MRPYWLDQVIIAEYNPIALTIHIESEKGCHGHTFSMKLYSRIALKSFSTFWLISNTSIKFALSNFLARVRNYIMKVISTIGRKVHYFVHAAKFTAQKSMRISLYYRRRNKKKLMKLKQSKEIITAVQCHAPKRKAKIFPVPLQVHYMYLFM